MNEINIKSNDKILIVAPHPDDECIGTGGILCKYHKQCTVIVLTDGALGNNSKSLSECKSVRQQEFENEMRKLEIENFFMLSKNDGMLSRDMHCLDNFNLKDYSKIFVTSLDDNHIDHNAAFVCLINALHFQNIQNVEIYQYEVHSALSCPTHYLDITEAIEKKEELIRCHKSQIKLFPYDDYARATSIYRGLQNRQVNKKLEVYTAVNHNSLVKQYDMTLQSNLQKFKMLYKVIVKWMENYEKDILKNFVEKNKIEQCVIYGYADLGRIVRKECVRLSVNIEYILDRKIDKDPDGNIKFYKLGEEREKNREVAVIVTAVYEFENIKANLKNNNYINIYSILDIILEA